MPYIPNSHGCFVCGDTNPLGLSVRFQTDGETVWASFIPLDVHMGYAGVTHGGVLSALMDETMGWAPAVAKGRFCMAVELNLEFRRSLAVGTPVIVAGRMTSCDRRIWEGQGEIRGTDGTLYVRGHGRFMPMSVTRSAEVLPYLLFGADTLPPSAFGGDDAEVDG